MRIALFTGNQPRHMYFAQRLAEVADDLYLVIESSTLFPGQRQGHIRSSEIAASYFTQVLMAEERTFGETWIPGKAEALVMPHGELNALRPSKLRRALDVDLIFLFGSSYVRDPLVNDLVARKAINLHMGIAPYYRGSSCNFWAVADNRPELVGATFHVLTSGLDSGPILWHQRPAYSGSDVFGFTMNAVKSAIDSAVHVVSYKPALLSGSGAPQQRQFELRYSRESDFTDEVIRDFLEHPPSIIGERGHLLDANDYSELVELGGIF